jgi:hypothetical protein
MSASNNPRRLGDRPSLMARPAGSVWLHLRELTARRAAPSVEDQNLHPTVGASTL